VPDVKVTFLFRAKVSHAEDVCIRREQKITVQQHRLMVSAQQRHIGLLHHPAQHRYSAVPVAVDNVSDHIQLSAVSAQRVRIQCDVILYHSRTVGHDPNVGFFIDPIAILATGAPLANWLRTAVRLALVPIIMGLGYEVLKFAGRHENWFTRIISAPGMWLQHITVREPEDDMIECAIKAFIAVIPEAELDAELAKIKAETAEDDDEASAEQAREKDTAEPPAEGSEEASEA